MELTYQLWNQTGQVITPTLRKIVLLHGMGGTGKLWRPIAAHLENQMAILAPDQRGHGGSRLPSSPVLRPETESEVETQTKRETGTGIETGAGAGAENEFTPVKYGQDIIDTLESLEFHPTWILGHSMGVRTALAAALLRPEWFQGVILVDLGFHGVAGGGLGDHLAQFLKILPQSFRSREAAREFMTTQAPDPSIGQYLLAVTERSPNGEVTFPFDKDALLATLQGAQNQPVRSWVHKLASDGMPLLILRGERSSVWSHEEFEEERKNFENEKSVTFQEIANAGHGLPFEQRQAMLDCMLFWIAKRGEGN